MRRLKRIASLSLAYLLRARNCLTALPPPERFASLIPEYFRENMTPSVPALRAARVFLRAMIRKRTSYHLPATGAPIIGEHGEKERVDLATLLQDIEYQIDALVNKRRCSDLNANHLFGRSGNLWGQRQARPVGRKGRSRC